MAIVFRTWPIQSGREALAVGGAFVSGLSWPAMLAEYNVAAGRLWALVPIWIGVAPYVFFGLQR